MTLPPSVQELRQAIRNDVAELQAKPSIIAVEACSAKYLGRKSGALTLVLKSLGNLPVEERKIVGSEANVLRQELEVSLAQIKQNLIASDSNATVTDLSLPGIAPAQGHLHPLTLVTEELISIFSTMGFMVYEGPELENEFYNFEALNIPANHPARDIQDTFFIKDGKRVMRTQTSNMQVRLMEQFQPPLRCIIPGRVFRNEATDASHEHTFYQLEGFVVDEHISIGHLIGTLRKLFSEFYKKPVKIRLRPGYFPFTEPSYEPDMSCTFCDQKGCKVCKYTGWIEMGGSGMIHPNVLKAAGYEAGKYTGFAFGMGINRLAMLKYSINDIRYLMENDLKFLEQF